MTTKSLLEMASLSGLSQSHISVSSFQVKSSVNDPCQEKRGSVRQGRGSEAGGERSSETQRRQAGAREPSADRPELGIPAQTGRSLRLFPFSCSLTGHHHLHLGDAVIRSYFVSAVTIHRLLSKQERTLPMMTTYHPDQHPVCWTGNNTKHTLR